MIDVKNRVVRTEKVNMMFELTHRVQGHCESENKNSPVKNTEESLLVGKIDSYATGFLASMCPNSTNITQRMTILNRLEKDLIAIEDFATYAWVVARIKIGN